MNTFEEILLLPGAAPVLAAKLSGRIIGRIADGFDNDPALGDMMNLFRAIEAKWPDQTMSLRDMYNLQLKSAALENQAADDALDGLNEAQRAVWLSEHGKETRVHKLQQALPKIVDLYANATPNYDSWDDLTPINQWSLLNATERGLHSRLANYRKWAQDDEDKGKTESNAITLRTDAEEAISPLFEIITAFLDDPTVKHELAVNTADGIRVPVRLETRTA